MRTLATHTRPSPQRPEGYIPFDRNALAQPELTALMGYKESDNERFLRSTLSDVATFGHLGVVQFMNYALQEYLDTEKNLQELFKFSRLTYEEKVKLYALIQAFKAVKKEFWRHCLKRAVDEVTKAH